MFSSGPLARPGWGSEPSAEWVHTQRVANSGKPTWLCVSLTLDMLSYRHSISPVGDFIQYSTLVSALENMPRK